MGPRQRRRLGDVARLPVALTANAVSTSVSQRSTAVKAPPWRTSSGRKAVKALSTVITVVDADGVDVGGEHLVVEPLDVALGAEQRGSDARRPGRAP